MTTRRRLDRELVRRGLADSREQAQALIAAGRVTVGGAPAAKAATQVAAGEAIAVVGDAPRWASRGATKLLGALEAFSSLAVSGRVALDVGASTGGFTDVLLDRGARQVIAVDVGYGQLAWRLRTDDRVVVLERTNVRSLTPDRLPAVPDLVVADLSFVSLTRALEALVRCAAAAADFVLLVKPQFEVGAARVGRGGVVRDPGAWRDALLGVANAAAALGLGVRGACASPTPGPSGNVEFFWWLRAGATGDVAALADLAVAEGERLRDR